MHDATRQQQTPWESSSLTADFSFFPGAVAATQAGTQKVSASSAGGTSAAGGARRAGVRSVESWPSEFRSWQPAEAYQLVIEEGTPEAFEAHLAVYSVPAYSPRVRSLRERRREMLAWYNAVTINTVASYRVPRLVRAAISPRPRSACSNARAAGRSSPASRR